MAENANSRLLSTHPAQASLQLVKALGDLFYHGRSKRQVTGSNYPRKVYRKKYRKGYKKRWVPYSQYRKQNRRNYSRNRRYRR